MCCNPSTDCFIIQISEEEVKQRLDKLSEDLHQSHTLSEVTDVTYCVSGGHGYMLISDRDTAEVKR